MEAKLVRVVKVLDADRLKVVECETHAEQFSRISTELKKIVEEDDNSTYKCAAQEICLYENDGLCYRVRVEAFVGDHLARCDFLDADLESRDLPVRRLRKVPGHLAREPPLVKTVVLRGIKPRSLLVTLDVRLKFGHPKTYDPSAFSHVDRIASASTRWLCLADKGSFQREATFQGFLYFGQGQSKGSSPGSNEIVFVPSTDLPPTSDLRLSASEVSGWNAELFRTSWTSLNRHLVDREFASCDYSRHRGNFILHLIGDPPRGHASSSSSSSSSRDPQQNMEGQSGPSIPPSVLKRALQLKHSIRGTVNKQCISSPISASTETPSQIRDPTLTEVQTSSPTLTKVQTSSSTMQSKGRGSFIKQLSEMKKLSSSRGLSSSKTFEVSRSDGGKGRPCGKTLYRAAEMAKDDIFKEINVGVAGASSSRSAVNVAGGFDDESADPLHKLWDDWEGGGGECKTVSPEVVGGRSSSDARLPEMQERRREQVVVSDKRTESTTRKEEIKCLDGKSESKSGSFAGRGGGGKHGAFVPATVQGARTSQPRVKVPLQMKYNPSSQLAVRRERPDVLHPHMVNNIIQASPNEEVWTDSPIDLELTLDLKETPFYQLIKRDKILSTITKPSALQSRAWRAILQLHNFFGVAQSPPKQTEEFGKENFLGGKTTSYILPILCSLNNNSLYSGLNTKCRSPKVIIICPSSNHVLSVNNLVVSLLDHQEDLGGSSTRLTSSYLFGKRNMAEQEASMRRGSDILVCTANSLLRMFDKGVLTFDNLCHLVFEEADILVDSFKFQLETIMDGFNLATMNRKSSSNPRQVLVFSQHWSPKLDDFVTEHQGMPVVVMTSKMEAFYSSQISVETISTLSSTRSPDLMKAFERDLDANNRNKTVIFCTTDEDAQRIHMDLLAKDQSVILFSSTSKEEEVRRTISAWKSKERPDPSTMVVSDAVLPDLSELSNVSCTIHFDIPVQQKTLAARLWLMRDHFDRTLSRQHKKSVMKSGTDETMRDKTESESGVGIPRPKTILLLTGDDKDAAHIRNLGIFLKRVGRSDPRADANDKTTNKIAALCDNFKSFGFCSNHLHCKLRHSFDQHLDVDKHSNTFIDLPFYSVVKIKVANIKTPFIYQAQVLEWCEPGGELVVHNEAKMLAIRLAFEYGRRGVVPVKLEDLKKDDLCAWRAKSGVSYRVKIIRLYLDDNAAAEAVVSLVDIGDVLQVKVSELLQLPPELKLVPYQAVEICVCRLKTVDQDPTWNRLEKSFITKQLQINLLSGRIVFKVGGTYWLDPLEECEKLSSLKVWITTLDVRRVLVDKGIAEENPEHIRLLLESSQSLTGIPEKLKKKELLDCAYTCKGLFLMTSTEELKEMFTAVYVTSVRHHHQFYVRKVATEVRLSKLLSDIERSIFVGETARPDISISFKRDMLVLVKASSGRWMRGRVSSILGEGEETSLEIFFVDTGEVEEAKRSDVVPMPGRFKDALPFQAIECSLVELDAEPVQRRIGDHQPYILVEEEEERQLEDPQIELKGGGHEMLTEDTVEAQSVADKPKKNLGSSVDPWGDDDDDDDDGEDKGFFEKLREDVLASPPSPAKDPSPPSRDPSEMQPPPVTTIDLQNGIRSTNDVPDAEDAPPARADISEYMMQSINSGPHPHVVTAQMIYPTMPGCTGGTKYGVRLYCYNFGDFVVDMSQDMVANWRATLTEETVNEMFENNDLYQLDDMDDDDDVAAAKREVLDNCKRIVREQEDILCQYTARDISSDIDYIWNSASSCRGLLYFLGLAVKFNRHSTAIGNLLKPLYVLLQPDLPGHCMEAKDCNLWESLCFHLHNACSSANPKHTIAPMLRALPDFLECNECCKEFFDRGGIKAICHCLKNAELDEEESEWSLLLLKNIVGRFFNVTNNNELADSDSKDEAANEDVEMLDQKGAPEATPVEAVAPEASGGSDPADATPGDLEHNVQLALKDLENMTDYAIPAEDAPILKKFFLAGVKKVSGDEDGFPSGFPEERQEEEREVKWVAPQRMDVLRWHEQMNRCPGEMKNIMRNPQLDLMDCLEVIVKKMHSGSDEVLLSSIHLLSLIVEIKIDNLLPYIQNFKKFGGLDNLVGIFKRNKDSEVEKEVLFILPYISNTSSYTRDYLRTLDLYSITKRILSSTEDEETRKLCSILLNVLTKRRRCDNVVPFDLDAANYALRVPETSTHQRLPKIKPRIVWSNVGEEAVKVKVDAKCVDANTLVVDYAEQSVSFSARSDAAEFVLELNLVSRIIPSECTAVVHSSEVVIILSKLEDAIWSRLTATKSFNVCPDLDALEREMENEVDEQDLFECTAGHESSDDEIPDFSDEEVRVGD